MASRNSILIGQQLAEALSGLVEEALANEAVKADNVADLEDYVNEKIDEKLKDYNPTEHNSFEEAVNTAIEQSDEIGDCVDKYLENNLCDEVDETVKESTVVEEKIRKFIREDAFVQSMIIDECDTYLRENIHLFVKEAILDFVLYPFRWMKKKYRNTLDSIRRLW